MRLYLVGDYDETNSSYAVVMANNEEDTKEKAIKKFRDERGKYYKDEVDFSDEYIIKRFNINHIKEIASGAIILENE